LDTRSAAIGNSEFPFALGRIAGNEQDVEPEWLSVLISQAEERSDPWVLLEGQANVEAALAGWWEVPGVLIAEDHPWEAPVWSGMELLRKHREELDELSDADLHGGVLGLAKIPGETADVAAFLKGLPEEALLVVCTRPSDSVLMGRIMRGADAFDAAGVIFGAEGASPFESETIRAAGDSVFKLAVRIADGGLILRCLLAAGFQLIGCEDEAGAIDAGKLPVLASRRALIVGDEVEGLGRFWQSACSLRVRGDVDEVLSHIAL
jgi:tRNA G18 (ribose-2'-O)-methylase SpoU